MSRRRYSYNSRRTSRAEPALLDSIIALYDTHNGVEVTFRWATPPPRLSVVGVPRVVNVTSQSQALAIIAIDDAGITISMDAPIDPGDVLFWPQQDPSIRTSIGGWVESFVSTIPTSPAPPPPWDWLAIALDSARVAVIPTAGTAPYYMATAYQTDTIQILDTGEQPALFEWYGSNGMVMQFPAFGVQPGYALEVTGSSGIMVDSVSAQLQAQTKTLLPP